MQGPWCQGLGGVAGVVAHAWPMRGHRDEARRKLMAEVDAIRQQQIREKQV